MLLHLLLVFGLNYGCLAQTTDSPQDCIDDPHDYRGATGVTKSGVPCSPWADAYHIPAGDVDEGLTQNYCRSPALIWGEDRYTVWCYTSGNLTDGGPAWEYCDVPYCNTSRSLFAERSVGVREAGECPDSDPHGFIHGHVHASPHHPYEPEHGCSPFEIQMMNITVRDATFIEWLCMDDNNQPYGQSGFEPVPADGTVVFSTVPYVCRDVWVSVFWTPGGEQTYTVNEVRVWEMDLFNRHGRRGCSYNWCPLSDEDLHHYYYYGYYGNYHYSSYDYSTPDWLGAGR